MENNRFYEELLNSGLRYLKYTQAGGLVDGSKLEVIKSLWQDTGKFTLFPQMPKTSGGKITKGLFIDVGKSNTNDDDESDSIVKILPFEFLVLINANRYFEELDRIIKEKCHGLKSRRDIIEVFDKESVRLIREFSANYNNSGIPLYFMVDNERVGNPDPLTGWKDRWGGKVKDFFTSDFLCNDENMRTSVGHLVTCASGEQLEKIINNLSGESMMGTPFLILDVVLGFGQYTGIDIVRMIRDRNIEKRESIFLPIIVVSKHFSDHTVTDALVMAKADWFISKGQIELNGETYDRMDELHIAALLLNAIRYREYFKYISLFSKFLLIYLFLVKSKDINTKCFIRINRFIKWIEGEQEGDFLKHKPPFITHMAARVNDKISDLLSFIEDAVESGKYIPETVSRSICTEIYNILEREMAPYKKFFGLVRKDSPPVGSLIETKWAIPQNGGTIEMNVVFKLLGIQQEIQAHRGLLSLADTIKGETHLYMIWEKLISKTIEGNKRWK